MPEDRSRFPSAYDRARSRDVGMAPQQEAPVSARIRTLIFDALGGNSPDMAARRRAMKAADMLTGAGAEFAVGMTPVLGDAQAMYEAKQAYDQGNMGRAAILGGLGALGMVPVVGDIAKKGGELAMDTASRIARAADQGFLPNTVYHGTRSDIPEFSVAGQIRNRKTDAPAGVYFFSSSPETAGSYTGAGRSRAGAANIIPANVKLEKPFVIDAANHGWSQFPVPHSALNAVDPLNYPASQNIGLDGSERILYMSTNDLAKKVAASGNYDGLVVKNVWDSGNLKAKNTSDVYAVFDPSNIRSVNAAFDPAKRGSANLLAGGAAAAIGVGAMTRAQQDEQNMRAQ